jgi:hypothetical protein
MDATKTVIADEVLSDEDPLSLAFTAYSSQMEEVMATPEDKICHLLQDFRYFRYRTTWTKARIMVEIGLAPLASKLAQSLVRAWIRMFCRFSEGVQKHGIAPKSNVESRLEQVLRQLNVWKER